jgi:hypothetical protein
MLVPCAHLLNISLAQASNKRQWIAHVHEWRGDKSPLRMYEDIKELEAAPNLPFVSPSHLANLSRFVSIHAHMQFCISLGRRNSPDS